MVVEQRWTVTCNINYCNHGKEKSLVVIRSWRKCSLNYPSEFCVELILFPGPKIST